MKLEKIEVGDVNEYGAFETEFTIDASDIEPPIVDDPGVYEYYYRRGKTIYIRNAYNKVSITLPDNSFDKFLNDVRPKRGDKLKIQINQS